VTTIAAASVNGVHALAADGMTRAGSDLIALRSRKIHQCGDAVAAGSGDVSCCNILASIEASEIKDFVESLRRAYGQGGWRSAEGEIGAPVYGPNQLFVNAEGVWKIGVDLSFLRIEEGLPAAIGAGMDYAIGAIESMSVLTKDFTGAVAPARDLVVHAIKIAIKRDAGTGGGIMLALRGAENFGPDWIT